jgi:hypothetical protein
LETGLLQAGYGEKQQRPIEYGKQRFGTDK